MSNLHGRATYTGDSRNMCRAMEQLERVIEKVTSSGVDSTPEDNTLSFTQMLDSLHGGHHGGYERAMDIGVTRYYLRVSNITEIDTSNQELHREVAHLRARVPEMDSLRDRVAEMDSLRLILRAIVLLALLMIHHLLLVLL
ncbi:uncharacterized protein LOC109820056 isoform X2 [Asparagus officinalis]|uniref:uncharacterized protein LOC109820056 isoform X2 n=1 Tax=Asparagus officinalis TaxID=4686 RepID=UPI00098E274B|nr:uncharacterized protein LOC109820056 isoform X2 [Asparagus officinalis]